MISSRSPSSPVWRALFACATLLLIIPKDALRAVAQDGDGVQVSPECDNAQNNIMSQAYDDALDARGPALVRGVTEDEYCTEDGDGARTCMIDFADEPVGTQLADACATLNFPLILASFNITCDSGEGPPSVYRVANFGDCFPVECNEFAADVLFENDVQEAPQSLGLVTGVDPTTCLVRYEITDADGSILLFGAFQGSAGETDDFIANLSPECIAQTSQQPAQFEESVTMAEESLGDIGDACALQSTKVVCEIDFLDNQDVLDAIQMCDDAEGLKSILYSFNVSCIADNQGTDIPISFGFLNRPFCFGEVCMDEEILQAFGSIDVGDFEESPQISNCMIEITATDSQGNPLGMDAPAMSPMMAPVVSPVAPPLAAPTGPSMTAPAAAPMTTPAAAPMMAPAAAPTSASNVAPVFFAAVVSTAVAAFGLMW